MSISLIGTGTGGLLDLIRIHMIETIGITTDDMILIGGIPTRIEGRTEIRTIIHATRTAHGHPTTTIETGTYLLVRSEKNKMLDHHREVTDMIRTDDLMIHMTDTGHRGILTTIATALPRATVMLHLLGTPMIVTHPTHGE